jgi:murein DD-endopeptidase MepM/ murein hydrolase activator NlpD
MIESRPDLRRTLSRIFRLLLVAGAVLAGAAAADGAIAGPARLAIYYGYPSLVNGAGGNLASATAHFAVFDVVVLGDGLQHPAHPDHANTAQIVTDLVAGGTEVYGYVDMGVTTQNLSIATAQQYVDEWDAIGVTGIFWDDAGYDYGVDRPRQVTLIGHTHAQGLKAFVNAWNPDDVFAFDGVPTPLQAGDWYLSESSPVADGNLVDLAFWWAKSQSLATYRSQTNVHIAAIATGDDGPLGWANAPAYRQSLWAAYLFAWDTFGFTNIQYSSSGPGANRLRPLPRVATAIGDSYVGVPAMDDATTFTRTTDTGEIAVFGSVGSGGGTFRGGVCDTTGLGDVIWPNCSATPPPQSSPFGPRQKASEGFRYDFHRGVDIPQPLGDPVYAMQDGIVRLAGVSSGYSDQVIQIRHRGAAPYLFSNVLHMDSVVVEVDDLVTAGDLVGYSGESVGGFDHMHMEFRDGCATQDCNRNPWDFLPYSDTAPVDPVLTGASLGGSQSALVLDASTLPDQLDFDGMSLDWGAIVDAGIDAINATTDPDAPLLMDHPVIPLGGGANLCIFPAPFNTASPSADYRFLFTGLPVAANGIANGLDVNAAGGAVALSPELPDLVISPATTQAFAEPGAVAVFAWTVTNTSGAGQNLVFSAQSAQSSPLAVTPDAMLLAAGASQLVTVEVDLRDELADGIGDCILFEVDAGGPHTLIAAAKALTSGSVHDCPDVPAPGCAAAERDSLAIRDDPFKPEKKQLQWKISRSAVAVDPADFGDPVDGVAGYRLCLYDATGGNEALAGGVEVAPGGTCGKKPCWKAVRDGFRFKDRSGLQGGALAMSLRGGEAKRSKFSVKAKGLALDLPGAAGLQYLNADTTVRVQLVESSSGTCWESVFTAPQHVSRNTATQFKAKRR